MLLTRVLLNRDTRRIDENRKRGPAMSWLNLTLHRPPSAHPRSPFPSCSKSSVLGTPTDSSWPNVTDLDDWNVGFPQWPRIGLAREYKDLGEIGINMLEVRYNNVFT